MFFKKFASFIAIMLLSFNLYANDNVLVDDNTNNSEELIDVLESPMCDASYSECMQVCDDASESKEQCFDSCDVKYDLCIKTAQ